MNYSKILPAAAGIIALTATIAFSREPDELEQVDSSRIKIVACALTGCADSTSANLLSAVVEDREGGSVYLVKVSYGDKASVLSIDAYTGKVLGNRQLPV